MIDAHIHADTRPYEDFEIMAVAGVEAAITCAHDPLKMSTSAVVLDHIDRLMNNDVNRAADNGLKLFLALGIHPRSITPDFEVILNKLPLLLEREDVVAIGEIGLETASSSEKDVFKRQLQLAQELEIKVIVHTPRRNKRDVTQITSNIIHENINPSLVLVDHVDNSIIDFMINFEGMLGITVQPQKMSPKDAVNLLDEYGFEKFLLNSDMSSSPSNPLSVPKTVHQMKLAGFEDAEIEKVSTKNASNFYGILI
jgi:predicted metal-dependent TIM-barrel fold hydrolase